jgi:hypothetical protein
VYSRPALRLAVFFSTLAGCGGSTERFGPAEVGSATERKSHEADSKAVSARVIAPAERRDGALLVRAGGSIESYLGGVRAVVRDAAGAVVGGGEQETDSAFTGSALELSLSLPAGEGYTLSLSASTADAQPMTCRATVGPLQIDADALATVQVLAWDCGDAIGYVPGASDAGECFWLGDWSFVSRSSAAVGEDIVVSAAGHGAEGKPARFAWATAVPAFGRFADPNAAGTSFRCQSAGQEQLLTVTIRDGECQKQLSHSVSCL